MSTKTIIAWTHHTFNIAWGCTKISPGCAKCYADTLSQRYGHDVWGPNKARRTFGPKHWDEPLKWNKEAEQSGKRQRVFTSSMCDVFEDHPTIAEQRAKLWPLIRATPWLDWQILTKRADRIADSLPSGWGMGWPNVWLGVSVENNDYVGRLNEHLAAIPATVRFVSYEPALGPLPGLNVAAADWIIFGGESGVGFRPMDLDWPRDIRRRCAESGTAFFFKQSAAIRTEMGTTLDGETVRQFPKPRFDTIGQQELIWTA